jgi:glycosyltransferase involved in cell wall biosynthesis
LPGDLFRPVVWNAGEAGANQRRLEDAGIEVRSFALPVSPRQVGRLVALAVALVRRRPALVHSYLYGRHWLDALCCRLAGAPYVTSRRNLAHWRQGRVLARERWRDRVSAAIVANSRATAEVAISEGAEARRVVVIPNGVPLPEWEPTRGNGDGNETPPRRRARQQLGLPRGCRVVGAVTSLKPIKDPLTLVRAFAQRPARRPEDRLVLVGEGPLGPALRAEARRLGVGEQLVLAGCHGEPARLLPAFDLFALPSLTEGCSNALIEAMAAGLPVVTTAVGGNREAVVDGRTGLLVPVGDTQAMGAALTRLLDDPRRAAALGQAGRARAAEHFSLDLMVKAHVELYRRLLSEGGPVDA